MINTTRFDTQDCHYVKSIRTYNKDSQVRFIYLNIFCINQETPINAPWSVTIKEEVRGKGFLMINTVPFDIKNLTSNKIVECYNKNPSFTRGLDLKIAEECGWNPMFEHLGYVWKRIFK